MARRKKCRVPEVLWRLFGRRARTLSETILSLIPPSSPSTCRCKGRRCLACVKSPIDFLLRPKDPPNYRSLLNKCFVVVENNAPRVDCYPDHRWTQCQLVIKTIEEMEGNTNVLRADYNLWKDSSTCFQLLTCSSWNLLSRRVGDDIMIYLLKNTSIFLPSSRRNYSQVSGSSVKDFFYRKHCKEKTRSPKSSAALGCNRRKRIRVDEADLAPKIDRSVLAEYGSSSTISYISCQTMRFSTSCDINIENENHLENLSREATLSTGFFSDNTEIVLVKESTLSIGTSSDDTEIVPVLEYQESTNQVKTNYQKRRRLLTNSLCCSISSNGNTENKNHQISLSGEATLSTGGGCDNDENFPNEEHQETTNQVKIKKASWHRRRKRSVIQTSNFYSLSDTNMHDSNASTESVHSPLNSSCSCCLRLQTLLNVTTESRIDKWFLFYNLVDSTSAFERSHILNRLKANLSGANALMKDIFSLPDEIINPLSQPCFHSTNCCLKNSKCLYHSLLQLLKKLLCKVKRCQHKALLEKHCPISSFIQDTDSCYNDFQEKPPGSEFILTQYYSPQKQVVSFIWAVCRSIIPPDLFGTKSSWRILRRNISRFVQRRRFEAFPLSHAMHKVKISMFPFLSNKYSLCSLSGNISNCTQLRYNILKKWMFWLFAKLVMSLLQAHFYVTESEHGKQNIFYYRKPIWRMIMDSTVMRSKDQIHYLSIDEESVRNISRRRSFGFSKVRLRPKGNSVRVLVNLKAKSKIRRNGKLPSCEGFESVNRSLRNLHVVLKDIQFKEPDLLGSSVFNYTDFHKKLCSFILSLKTRSTSIPTLFVLVADVRKAFDSVNQDKLLEIMNDLLRKDYLLKKSHQVICKKKSLWVDQNLVLPEQVRGKETSNSSSLPGILVNQGESKKITKEELQFILNEHVKGNILRLDSAYYLQREGIPQGSVLSPLLYSFYYGDLEKTVLLPLFRKPSTGDSSDHKSMLVRFIDDYLFISTSKEQAVSFFSMLSQGFSGYNCTMNQMKFGRNFDINHITGSSANTEFVGPDGISFLQWSGLFINCRTLEIQVDYTRYTKIHISSTLTIRWGNKPSLHLKSKLCDYLRPKCHPIFYDSNINSPVVVRLNIYQAFLLCAMKFHCYIDELFTFCKLDATFSFAVIERSLRFMHKFVKKQMFSTCFDSTLRPKFHVERNEVMWLGIKAYIRVLRKKETKHKELLSILKSRLLRHEKVFHVSSALMEAVDDLYSSVIWKIKY